MYKFLLIYLFHKSIPPINESVLSVPTPKMKTDDIRGVIQVVWMADLKRVFNTMKLVLPAASHPTPLGVRKT